MLVSFSCNVSICTLFNSSLSFPSPFSLIILMQWPPIGLMVIQLDIQQPLITQIIIPGIKVIIQLGPMQVQTFGLVTVTPHTHMLIKMVSTFAIAVYFIYFIYFILFIFYFCFYSLSLSLSRCKCYELLLW